jgi:hypothetical protein
MSERGKILKRYKKVTGTFLSIVSDMAKLQPDDINWVFSKLSTHHKLFEDQMAGIQKTFEAIKGTVPYGTEEEK